jgi:hypothetical protein
MQTAQRLPHLRSSLKGCISVPTTGHLGIETRHTANMHCCCCRLASSAVGA